MSRWLNWFGWYGVGAILLAYALVTLDIIQVDTWTYLLLNLTGSLVILLEAWQKRDFQPAILNLIWMLIALISIIRPVPL